MKKTLLKNSLIIMAGLPMLMGCVYEQPAPPPPPPVASENPPPPEVEVVPPAPGPVDVWFWVPGTWDWRGRWVWARGHWAARPHPGAVWVGGGWVWHGHRRVWVHGYWR